MGTRVASRARLVAGIMSATRSQGSVPPSHVMLDTMEVNAPRTVPTPVQATRVILSLDFVTIVLTGSMAGSVVMYAHKTVCHVRTGTIVTLLVRMDGMG